MKKLSKIAIAVLLSVLLLIPSTLAVFYYTRPMEAKSYDLFRLLEDGEEAWEGGEGWSVYTEEKGERKELTPDGNGGYSGLSYEGQTFYYSRTLTEELDSPTLQVSVANRTVSIFLDGEMIYTDCPELDNRIGYLDLPMLEYDRDAPVIVTLTPDYQGKTVTIAQSTESGSEKQVNDGKVWPCEVKLYCGYAYESSLIASSSQTMLAAGLLFALEIFLLAAFIWSASAEMQIFQLKLPVFAMAVLFQMCGVLVKADFFSKYFGILPLDCSDLFSWLSMAAYLLLLTLYAVRLRPLFGAAAALQWIGILLSLTVQIGKIVEYGDMYLLFVNLPQITGFLALAAALAGGFYLWKCGSPFFSYQAQCALALAIGYALFLVLSIPLLPDYAASVFTRLRDEIVDFLPGFSLQLLWNLCIISGLAAVFLELMEQAAEHRAELAVLSAKNELAMESYENLRLQSEEVMMLRHDTVKHYTLLRSMAQEAPEQVAGYLDRLIGQAEAIRPVVSCRNQTLNILLNGKLSMAAAKKIDIQIDRCDAPEKLPLSDTELCSLVVNILDNAINSAAAARRPYLKLDFYLKGQLFVFSCENSLRCKKKEHKKAPIFPEHGYGLKIIRQIMNRFGDNMLSIEQLGSTYRITVVIPCENEMQEINS